MGLACSAVLIFVALLKHDLCTTDAELVHNRCTFSAFRCLQPPKFPSVPGTSDVFLPCFLHCSAVFPMFLLGGSTCENQGYYEVLAQLMSSEGWTEGTMKSDMFGSSVFRWTFIKEKTCDDMKV